ncbi:hypothetical protein SGHV117 [Glossina pallidipes salivary gland hypertrophy virus]|uniref:RING-type domain-containing protein n=1 Tax=Glossina hytrovirus (isolate Glossina pallidipes/Ethiopia/Seibersdorf/-) TaxID=379529 RepID=B0YLS1_GHVS|nr:hypothetical protein SGHV117 [Glossina pallidipes salivary gland hypertrophy virus]ABQ08890.1 hypothetical protein SGHV117 [Glossina pallidipes salivary gland hypertrophy virus]
MCIIVSIMNCAICTEFLNDRVVSTSCGHIFHKPCIYNWNKISLKCPICRKTINDVRNVYLHFDDNAQLVDKLKQENTKLLNSNFIIHLNNQHLQAKYKLLKRKIKTQPSSSILGESSDDESSTIYCTTDADDEGDEEQLLKRKMELPLTIRNNNMVSSIIISNLRLCPPIKQATHQILLKIFNIQLADFTVKILNNIIEEEYFIILITFRRFIMKKIFIKNKFKTKFYPEIFNNVIINY